jgi:branched-chain amino acid transport system ATP-binding protein
MKESLRILKDEHRSLSAVLLGLKHLARLAAESTVKPDFRAFRAMIRYIDEYPERLHHPKEDTLLFARLKERSPEARPLIAELQNEHVRAPALMRELERALLFYEDSWPNGAKQFADLLEAYSEFHWSHMTREERDVLPLAERHLTSEDWEAIDAGFAANTDPLAQICERDFEALFTRIVNLAPAPIGLGDPWKKSA